MRRIFLSFCRNQFLMSPLHYLSSRSDYGFEFEFEFETPLFGESLTRRLGE
jgi:hypothetical protein